MDEQRIIDIATKVYNTQGTQYGVARVPGHVHNGIDANRISIDDIIDAQITTALGTTGAVNLNPNVGTVFTVTPTGAVQITPTTQKIGAVIYVIIKTSGTTSYTITFDTGFTANGTLSTGTVSGVYFTVMFVSDGVNFREIARTPAMLPT